MRKSSAFLALLLTAALLSDAAAPMHTAAYTEGQEGAFTYWQYDDYIAITDFDETVGGDITIPSEIAGLPVTMINYGAFSECPLITSIHIPASIKEIYSGALATTNVEWGISIGGSGIDSSMTAYTVDENNPNYCSVDGVVFTKDMKTLVQFPTGSELSTYTIPDGVEIVDSKAFYFVVMNEVILPDSLLRIEDESFMGLVVEELTLPPQLTYIGVNAFSNFRGVDSIVIPESVTFIGSYAFYYTSLDEIFIESPSCIIEGGRDTFSNTSEYDEDGFRDFYLDGAIYGAADSTAQAFAEEHGVNFALGKGVHDKLMYRIREDSVSIYGVDETNGRISGDFVIPSEIDGLPVTKIENSALRDQNMTSVVIPDTVEYIGEFAFWSNYSLKKITLGSGLREIDEGAFCGVDVEKITFPEGLEIIGAKAFENTALTSITIPASVTSIGSLAFGNINTLAEIHVAANNAAYKSVDNVLLTKDGTKLLQYPIGSTQKEYQVPSGVQIIGTGAFSYDSYFYEGLQKLTLPDSVEIIEGSAFEYNCALAEVTLSNNLKSVGSGAFSECYDLKALTFPATLESIGWRALHFSTVYSYNDEFLENTGEFTFLNPDCILEDSAIGGGGFKGTLVGYGGSTIEQCAKERGLTFRSLGEAPFDPVYSFGDLDGNGSVNATDAAMLLAAAAALGAGEAHELNEVQLVFGDVNGNSHIEATDAALILMYAAYNGAGGDKSAEEFIKEELTA